MTITVSLPNGSTAQFPDGTTPETIEKALRSIGGPQAPAAAPAQAPKQDDPITAQVRSEIERDKKLGLPARAGLTRQFAQGMTFNAADEILAGLSTPLEMISRKTLNPIEAFKYAKARENLELEEGRKENGALGTGMEVLGGVGSGVGLARAGLTLGRPGMGLMGRTGASAGDAALYGSVAGAMEGDSLSDRAKNAMIGGLGGAVIGGAMPLAGAAISTAAAPVVSNVRARLNPQQYATTQLARAVSESGRTPQQLADDIAAAAREGQGEFTLADALGNAGQRMLSGVTRSPGPGRTTAVEFLEQRQAGQGRRVANALAEGFEAPVTAAQATQRLTQARNTAADTAFDAVRSNAGNVDPTAAIRRIDQTLRPGVNGIVNPGSGIADDSVEAALAKVRSRLTDGRSVATEFQMVMRARDDLADEIEKAVRAGAGNKARLLRQVRGDLDAALESASTGYRDANRNFAQASRVIDSVEEGATAARRGRSEDIIPDFRARSPEQQSAYRVGYADPLIAETQGAAFGANKARPLTSDAFTAEANAISRQPDLMLRRVGRENTMFETRNHALGGSRTADNLADQGALGVDPTLIGHLFSGNFAGAARSALAASSNVLNGNTTEVRNQLAQMLLSRGNARTIQQALTQAQQRIERAQLNALLMSRGAMGGGAELTTRRQ